MDEGIFESGITAPNLHLTDDSNQLTLGTTGQTTVNDVSTINRTINIPATLGDCDFVLTDDSGQIIGGDNTFTGINSFSNASGIKVDTINEYTLDNGVTIENLKIEDDNITFYPDSGYDARITVSDTVSETNSGLLMQQFPSYNYIAINNGGISMNVSNSYNPSATVNIYNENTMTGVSIQGTVFKSDGIYDTPYSQGLLQVNSLNDVISSNTIYATIQPDSSDIRKMGTSTNRFLETHAKYHYGGVLDASSYVSTDTIYEKTANYGIDVDFLKIKDGKIAQSTYSSNGILHSNSGTGEITSSTIVNNDVNASAGIVYSKLNLSNSVKASDINSQSATNGYVLTADGIGGASWMVAGGVDLQDAYDNSTSPEIVTDVTRGALTIKRGSASDTDNVLEIMNGSGTIKGAITGDSKLKIDTINENTVDNGVNIETVNIKDGIVTGSFDGPISSDTSYTIGETYYIPFKASGTSQLKSYWDFLFNPFSGELTSRSIKLSNFTNAGILHNDTSGTVTSSLIVDADIHSSANISDTKLNTISTAGKVANSATSGTDSNTPSSLVARDASGNFSAGTITASLNGNATSATSATSATTATNATNISITDTTTASAFYPLFASSTSGNQLARTHGANLKYFPGSNALECAYFTGIASKASDIYLSDDTSSANTHYILFSLGSSGYVSAKCDSTGLTYQPSTNTITASLNGNASTATSATSATNTTNVNLTAGSGTTNYITFSASATGNQPINTDTGLTFDSTNNKITTTTFAGDLNGTINTATTGTTQSISDNSTKISTTAYADRSAGVLSTLPHLISQANSYVDSTASTSQRMMFGDGSSIGRSTGSVNNVSPVMFYIDSSLYPSIPGKTAKLLLECLLITNTVTMLTGSNTLTVAINRITASGGTTGNTSYTLSASSSSIAYTTPSTSLVQRSVASTINIPTTGLYVFTVTCSSAPATNSCANLNAKIYLVYE